MAEATANLRLGLIDDGLVKGVSNISTQLTNLQLASAAVSAGLPLLEKGLKSNAAQYLVGAKNAKLLANNLGDLIEYNKQLGNVLGKASNVAFYAQQLATLAKGAADAYRSLKRIPETLEQMERSGVSTGSIQGFMQLRDAIGGSQAAVESFAQVAVSKLNAVEQASARVGTILKSSTNFNEQGVAKRANAQDLGQNRKQLQELLRGKLDNTVTSTEALLGQYEVLSGGFTSSKASQQVLDPGLKLIGIAKAGGQAADPTATLQLLTKTLRAYGLEASQATRVSAILNSTVENGITTIQELSMTFGQASQVAKTAGISIEDLAAATSVLTAQGTSTPVALTGIQALARNIIDKTPEATKELAKLRDAQGNRIRLDIREVQQKGLVKVVQDLFQSTGGNQELLAKILPDSLAYRTALGLYSNKGQDFANVSASIKANANAQSLNEVFDTATGDRISRFQKIANRFEETIIQIGESLAPIFEPGIAYLEKVSKLIASIPDPIKKAIGSYLSFQIQLKSASIAFGQLSGAVVSVLGNFALLRVINLVLTGQFGKQIAIIKELILQKKGLGAVVKQIVGLDQSRLLTTEAATEAIQKEGVIQKTVNAVKEKTNEVIKKNVQGYAAQNEAVARTGKTLTGVKGKFAEFIETIRNTSVGKKIDELTGKFSGQKEAVKELAKNTQEYFDGVKAATSETISNAASRRKIDQQIEEYRKKRLAELEKSIPDSPDSFSDFLESDPEIQREKRREELLAKRESQRQKRRERKLEQLNLEKERQAARQFAEMQADQILSGIEGKTFGESIDNVENLAFGNFADQEEEKSKARRKQLLENIRARKESENLNQLFRGHTFGELLAEEDIIFPSSGGDTSTVGGTFGTFMQANPEVDEPSKKTTRDQLRERAKSRNFGNLNRTRELFEAGELVGQSTRKVSLLKASITGVGTAMGAMGTAIGAVTGITGELLLALAPLAPIVLAVGAAFALAGKEIQHLFGGGAANELSRGLQGILDKMKELEEKSGKDGALLAVKNTLAEMSEGSSENLSPVQSQLEKLRSEGKLTQGQFNAMGDAFRKAGEDGKVTAEELSVLQNQIESFRAGAPGQVEEGVIDKIKGFFSLESIGKALDTTGNFLGAGAKNLINPFDPTSWEEIGLNREADKLLKPLSELRDVLDEVGDASFLSAEKTKKLAQGIFLTNEARELAAKGSQIQGTALELENKETDRQIEINENLITKYQEQAKTVDELIKNTNNPQLKQQLKDQFNSAQVQIDNLQKRSEKLKQAREAIIKYYNETLPVLQQTILQSAVNPLEAQNALNDSFEVFRDKYVDEGKVFLKDVQQQRTEAQAVLDQTLQNYDRNLLGTAEVGERIKKVLDESYISVTKDGKKIKGSIFDIDTQKNLVNQISQFNSQATTERLTQIDLESSKVAASGQFRLASEEDVVKKTTELQKEKLNLQKAQIEEEIKLRIQYGIKTTDLENKLQQTILEIDQVNFNEREKLIQKELDKRLQAIEVQRSEVNAGTATRTLSEENAQKKIAQLQIEESKLKADELKRQLDEYAANGVKNVQLENQYAIARNQIREAEAKEKERLIQQELGQRTQALEIEKNQIQVLAEEGLLGQEDLAKESARLSVEQAQLKANDLERQINQLRANGQSSVSLEQEYAQQRLQIRSLEAREKKRLIEQELQEKIKALDIEQSKIEVGVSEHTISEKDGQKAIAQFRIQQEKLRLAELERQLDLLRSNDQKSVSLEQEVSAARLKIRKAEADERNRLEELQIETLKKQLENETQRSNLRQQSLEAEYDILQKQAQLVETITNSRNQLADTESRYVQNQLQNQAKLTRDPLKQAEIELRILNEREADLARTQKAETESLAIRQKLAALDLQRQQTQIQTQKLELESQAQILAIELKRAISQKRSPEEIEAIRLQIQGNKQRTESLNQQSNLINQQINQQGGINRNEQRRIRLSQQTEAENLKIEKTLARQRVIQEQIDKVAKAFVLTQQKIQQEYAKQTSVLENQNTIIGFQKQLIEARQKAFNDKLNFVTSELNLASQLITNDKQRQVLAQAAATIKLKALDEQQKAEREVLLLNQQQAKVQQQIEAIKLRGQQAQNKADTAQAYADLLKLKASGATQEEVYAGEMNLSAKLQAGQALGLQASLLPLQGQLLDFNQQQELINLDNKQRLDRLQAKSELVSTLPDGYQKDKYKQQIINELLSDVYGKKVTDWNYTSVLDQIQRDNNSDLRRLMTGEEQQQTMRGRSGSVYIDYGAPPKVQGLDISSSRLDDISNQLKNLSEPVVPNLQLGFPSAPNTNIGNTEVTRFQQTAERVENTVKMEIGGINISVHSSEDAGKKMEQEILNTLDRVMVEAKRRL